MLGLLPAAFFAGVLMFLAPCTLPIVPGYLAFIAGVPEADMSRAPRDLRRRVFLNALSFVLGFTLVFVLFGVFAAQLGEVLGPWRYALGRAAGILLVLFGLLMLGAISMPAIAGEWHARIPRSLRLGHPDSSFLIGVLFALGWSPCIGPILGSILFLASASQTALQGAGLLLVFSLGLSVPFLLTALLMGRANEFVARLGRLSAILQAFGGIVLIGLGVCIALGEMGALISWAYGVFSFLGYDRLQSFL